MQIMITMNILNSNGIILVPMAYQSQDGKPSMVIRYFFQDDGNMVVHRFFNNYYFYNDGTIARNKRLNIPTHYITREFPNIYEFDNDGVGKFISSDFKDLRQRLLILSKIKWILALL